MHVSFDGAAFDALWQECRVLGHLDPAYVSKQLHRIPSAPVVDRVEYIVDQCRGKRVLNLGCDSGALHGAIAAVANGIYGVDVQSGVKTWLVCDLDVAPEHVYAAAQDIGVEVIVAGEIMEHLGNPGRLLTTLRSLACPVVLSVPNAFSAAGRQWLKKGYENVHRDHVAWYSYSTLCALLVRSGYVVADWAWYGGEPCTAEGLIMRTA
jgi:2-polyprenyl-3-methyl-5-hydroxy-6-metoxy-1,4-benzoquinol methylase